MAIGFCMRRVIAAGACLLWAAYLAAAPAMASAEGA